MMALSRTLSIAISVIIICAVFYNAFSNYVLGNSEGTSLASGSFNFQNRIKYLNDAVITPELEPADLEHFQMLADDGTIIEPLNARIFALAGAFKQRVDKEAAQRYYLKALALKPTDRIALTQRYIYLVEKKEYKQAIPLIELIAARWPRVFGQLLSSVPYLLQTSENIDEILNRFQSRLSRLGSIVRSLARKADHLDLAYKLVLDAHKKYNLDVHDISIPVFQKLLSQNRVSEAYLLFYKTLFEEEKNDIGYVFNSKFLHDPTAAYFDWNIKHQAGVNMRRIPTRVLSSDGVEQSKLGGLEIKFLNAPVVFSNVSQLLYLPKLVYELSVKYSVDEIRGPTPISVKLFCTKTKTILTQIELSNLKTVEEVKTATFEVPKTGCDLQKILITNNNTVESWRNRFNGKLTVHEIGIKLANE